MEQAFNRDERRVALNAGTECAALALSTLARFFITPYLVFSIGKTLFGLQALAFQWMLFLGMVASCMSASYYRYAAEHHARREYDQLNVVLSAGLLLALASSALFIVGGIVSAIYVQPLLGVSDDMVGVARVVLLITALAAALRSPLRVWTSPAYITQRFYLESIASATHIALLIPLVLLAFHLHGPSIVTWVALDNGLPILCSLFILVPLGRRALPQLKPSLRLIRSWAQVRPLITFGTLRVLSELAFLLYFATDTVMISHLDELGVGMIVYYGIAQRWIPQILALLMAFVSVLTPMMTGDFALGNLARMRSTYIRAVRYCMVLALYPCVVLGIFADPFIRHWMGGDFAEVAAPVMVIMMIGFVPTIPGHVATKVLIASARLARHAWVSLIGGILNIVLGVYFVKVGGLGLYGIALATVITLAISYGANTPHAACRVLGLPFRTLLAQGYVGPLLGAVPTALAAGWMRRAWDPGNLAGVFLQMACCGVIYAASVWLVSLTREDRAKLRTATLAGLARFRPSLEEGEELP